MKKKPPLFLCLFLCLFLLWACAAERPAIQNDVDVPDSGNVFPEREPSPEDLLHEALRILPPPEGTAQFVESQAILDRLIRQHPDSSWRGPAEALLILINRYQACREKAKADLNAYDRLLSQKTKCDDSENQCRMDLSRILQENEQLKKDLQNLKNLEIELEQRNRRRR